MSTGVAEEDKPYLDWMDALIRDLLAARPMWRPVYKRAQTSGQILATTYSGFYNAPTNKEINGIIDLSMTMDAMARLTIKLDRLIVLSKSSLLGWFLHVSLIVIIKGRSPVEVSLIVIIKQV